MLFSWSLISVVCSTLVLHLTGSNPIFQINYSALSVHMISLNLTKVAVAYHKAQYLDNSFHSLYYFSEFTYFIVVTQSPIVC